MCLAIFDIQDQVFVYDGKKFANSDALWDYHSTKNAAAGKTTKFRKRFPKSIAQAAAYKLFEGEKRPWNPGWGPKPHGWDDSTRAEAAGLRAKYSADMRDNLIKEARHDVRLVEGGKALGTGLSLQQILGRNPDAATPAEVDAARVTSEGCLLYTSPSPRD